MSWDTFHFICRNIGQGISHSRALQLANALDYPNIDNTGLLASTTLDRLSKMPSEEVKPVAQLLGALDLQTALSSPPKLNRLTGYLFLLLLVYLVMNSLFLGFVTPQFLAIFQEFGQPMPGYLQWYSEYGGVLGLGVFTLILLNVVIALQIRQLYRFPLLNGFKRTHSGLLPRAAKKRYTKIVQLIQFPLGSEEASNPVADPSLSRSLTELKDAGSDLAVELQRLIAREGAAMSDVLYKHTQKLLFVTALAIVGSIALFAVSAYSPIFIMGEVL